MGAKFISFIDSNGNIVLNGKITSLPLKEEYIINKSVELFNDCEPCIIHRTFIMKKIFFEIDEYFNKLLCEGKNEISIECVPESIIQPMDLNFQVQKFLIS